MGSKQHQLSEESETEKIKSKGSECPDCQKRVTWNSKALECGKSEKWFHIVCRNISKEHNDQMGDVVCVCTHCKNKMDWDTGNKRKLFERYVDDIICPVKDDPDKFLNRVIKLHNNLEFTIESLNENQELAFLDMTVHVDTNRKTTCKWYQKPTDTDTTLNFRSFVPLQHKKNIIEGTVHRLLRCTSDWKSFDEALKINENFGKRTNIRKVGRLR